MARAREEVKTALQRVMGAYSGASDVEQGAERVAPPPPPPPRTKWTRHVPHPVLIGHAASLSQVAAAAARLDALWGAVAPLAADSSPAERALQRVLIDGQAPAAVALSGTHAPAGPDGRPGPPELEALLQRWAACLGQVQRQLTHHASGRAGLESLGRAADGAQNAAQQSQQGLASARAARGRLEAARDEAAAAARELRAALGPPPAEPFTAASLSAVHPLNLSTSPSSASAVCMPAPSAPNLKGLIRVSSDSVLSPCYTRRISQACRRACVCTATARDWRALANACRRARPAQPRPQQGDRTARQAVT